MSALPPREGLLIEALMANSTVQAATGGAISTRLGQTFPTVRVTLLGGPGRPVESTGQPEFQIECWAAGTAPEHETQAEDMAVAIEGQIPNLAGSYSLGKVLGAYSFGDLLHSPDPTTSRERFILTMGLLIQ